jgi:hypothetical protein
MTRENVINVSLMTKKNSYVVNSAKRSMSVVLVGCRVCSLSGPSRSTLAVNNLRLFIKNVLPLDSPNNLLGGFASVRTDVPYRCAIVFFCSESTKAAFPLRHHRYLIGLSHCIIVHQLAKGAHGSTGRVVIGLDRESIQQTCIHDVLALGKDGAINGGQPVIAAN